MRKMNAEERDKVNRLRERGLDKSDTSLDEIPALAKHNAVESYLAESYRDLDVAAETLISLKDFADSDVKSVIETAIRDLNSLSQGWLKDLDNPRL